METYHGLVRTPADAIKLFEACRLGLLPRVQRRLSEKERQSIRSGSVFVWDEREAGMRRWTDGKSWSASRVSGSFLTYREMEGKRGGGFGPNNGRRGGAGKTPESSRGSDEDQDDGEPEGYRYKADGLMKQSFSITTSTGQHLHLISYSSRPGTGDPNLVQPSDDPALRGIVPVKGMYPESSMGETNQTPALTRAPMQHPPFVVASPHHQHPHAGAHPQAAAYHPHYAHGYGWPISPAPTPPYAYATPYPPGHPYAAPPPHGHHHPHAPHGGPPPPTAHHPSGHYTHAPPSGSYDNRVTLPPPHATAAPALSPYQNGQRPSPPGSAAESPRADGLSAPSLQRTGSIRDSPSDRLPPLNGINGHSGQNGISSQYHSTAAHTPPTRASSVTPPRSSHSEAHVNGNNSNKASLSALLHPQSPATVVKTEDGVTGSPKAEAVDKCGVSEDARALRMLDRKFCIPTN